MPIVQQGALNTTALVVPDLYVQIVPPQILNLNGVPTDIVGIAGTAQWGPVGTPVIVGSASDYRTRFGALQNRKYDMGTPVACAIQQGAQNFRCVRVTDGTDAAAAGSVNTIAIGVQSASSTGGTGYTNGNAAVVTFTGGTGTGATATCKVTAGVPGAITMLTPGNYTVPPTSFTIPGGSGLTPTIVSGPVSSLALAAKYTGSLGNGIVASLAAGALPHSWSLTIAAPGLPAEIYANIVCAGGGSPTAAQFAAFWTALATAVNSGTAYRGASGLVTAAYTGNPATVATFSQALTGGADGATTISDATLIGVDTVPRTGMYALRSQGCSIAVLADADGNSGTPSTPGANNQWNVMVAFGLSEGIYMIASGPAGDTIANAIVVAQAAGLDSYAMKLLFGDWIRWNDPINGVRRLVSPTGFVAGRLANLSPEQSSLNKALFGVVGSQTSGLNPSQFGTYAAADLGALFTAGIDVIANPQPGGAFWGVRGGVNTAISNPGTNGDNYTRLTNYIASTLAKGMGFYVGQVIDNDLFQAVTATLNQFLGNMLSQGLLQLQVPFASPTAGATNTGLLATGLPYAVTCNATNNPASRTSIGYLQADVQVRYGAIAKFFIVNLEGGQTVSISIQPAQ